MGVCGGVCVDGGRSSKCVKIILVMNAFVTQNISLYKVIVRFISSLFSAIAYVEKMLVQHDTYFIIPSEHTRDMIAQGLSRKSYMLLSILMCVVACN